MANVKEIEAFLNELQTEAKDNKGPTQYVNRDKLDCQIDEKSGFSEMFEGYILEGYTEGIEGNYGTSTACRMIRPNDGRRLTLWLTGFEQEHLKSQLANWTDEGHSFPHEIKFVRHKVLGRNGRQYNRFSAQVLSSGEDVVVPPVPEDQIEVVGDTKASE